MILDRQLSGVKTSVTTEFVILNDLVSDIAEEFAALAISAISQTYPFGLRSVWLVYRSFGYYIDNFAATYSQNYSQKPASAAIRVLFLVGSNESNSKH